MNTAILACIVVAVIYKIIIEAIKIPKRNVTYASSTLGLSGAIIWHHKSRAGFEDHNIRHWVIRVDNGCAVVHV